MIRTKSLTVFVVSLCGAVALTASSVLADKLDEILGAAIALKQAHVMRSYEKCRSSGSSDIACRGELEALHPREISALARIAGKIGNVGESEISKAIANCYDPSHDYLDLIECWEQVAARLESGQVIIPAKRQAFKWDDLPRNLASLDSVQRRSLFLCVRGTANMNFSETVSHNLSLGGADATWALKVFAWENKQMADFAKSVGWPEMQDYYEQEALASKKLIRGEIGFSEYRQMAKQNEGWLASALAPEALRQSVHERNFSALKELCDDVASAVIGMAKAAASQ